MTEYKNLSMSATTEDVTNAGSAENGNFLL